MRVTPFWGARKLPAMAMTPKAQIHSLPWGDSRVRGIRQHANQNGPDDEHFKNAKDALAHADVCTMAASTHSHVAQ